MTRITTVSCRSILLTALVAALLMGVNASDASAQLGNCRCANVDVINNAHCAVTLVLQGANETQIVVGAGSTGQFPCQAGLNVLVQDCRGNLHPLSVGGCVDVVIEDGCCTRVCLVEVARGCYRVVVHPPVVDCPCT
jgi:hypothetical protein